MKLNIINFNPEIKEDIQYVDELIKMLNNIKENLTTKCYTPYQNFLTKMNKFINMVTPNFEKELNDVSSKKTFYDEADDLEDDNISIASISEYEDDDEIDEIDELEIKKFEDITEVKMFQSNERFDFEYIKC
jgi:hypothetical protein